LKEIKNYGFRVEFNGITFISKLIRIYPAVLQLKHADFQTDMTIFIQGLDKN
jgi:hypothetical protein